MADWERMPAELLLKISGFCSHPPAILGVCKAWKEGLEGVVTALKVKPALPLNLAARFQSLTTLDLKQCNSVTPAALKSLGGLPRFSLSLSIGPECPIAAIAETLRGIKLETLLLSSTGHYGKLPDAKFWLLEGLPVSVMKFHRMDVSDFGIAALRGMPLKDLWLGGNFTDDGIVVGPRGMQLTDLDLSECVLCTCEYGQGPL